MRVRSFEAERRAATRRSDDNRTMAGPPLARVAAVVVCAALALGAAGCGGGGDEAADGRTLADVQAAVKGLHGDELTSKLAELAADEPGTLTLYTSLTDELSDELAEMFRKRYGVAVKVYAASSDDIAQRMSEESAAGHRGADLVEVNVPVLIALSRAGLLADRVPVDTQGIAGSLIGKGWIAHEFIRFAVSWNSKHVPPGSEPKRWEDLADPRWDGKVGMELGDFDWYAGLRSYWEQQGKSAAEIDRLFGAIAQGAKVIKGHSLIAQLLASGEISAGVDYSHLIGRAAKEGAPLAWKPVVEPVFLRSQGMGFAAGSPRPATAALYVQWVLTAVQDRYASDGWVPVRGAAASGREFEQIVLDAKAITANEKRWSNEYDRLMRRGTIVPEG